MRRKFLFGISALLIAALFYVVCNVISICRYSTVSSDACCDCAIVLGAAASDEGVSKVYAERLNHAKKLYEEKRVQWIIVTGGLGEGNTKTDAEAAMEYLMTCGIPREAIFLEKTSAITQENLENAAEIMSSEGLTSALIVSDPLHMRRAMLLADDAGIEAYPSPTQTSAYKTLKTKIPFVARETFFYIGYKWYRCLIPHTTNVL